MTKTPHIHKGDLEIDPRGLIYESYRMDEITPEECRVIFLDWAMGSPSGEMKDHLNIFLEKYGRSNPNHPMTTVIKEGLSRDVKPKRRGGRLGKRG